MTVVVLSKSFTSSLRWARRPRGEGDDGLEAESQDRRSECRRCREHGYIERGVDQEGHEAEESPEAPRAVRARGEASLERARCAVLVRTVVGAVNARSAVGHKYASTVVYAVSARSAVGLQSVSTVVGALMCKECGGASICEHGRIRSQCKECGGSQICEHGRRRARCKECGGHQYASTAVSALDARSAVGINMRARS